MAKRYRRGNPNQSIDEEQTSSIYWFWLPLWYLLAIVLSVPRRFIDSDCLFGIFWPCIFCSSLIYWFWLPLWYLLAIVLSVLRRFTDSDFPFGIFWPLYCLFFVDLLILISPLVSFGHCIVDEEQTIQWPKDTKGVIRISKSTKNRQYNGQKIRKRQSESVNRRRTDNTMAKRYQRGNQNQ
jgi:hypothetical protein